MRLNSRYSSLETGLKSCSSPQKRDNLQDSVESFGSFESFILLLSHGERPASNLLPLTHFSGEIGPLSPSVAEDSVDQVLRYPAQVSDVFVAGEPTFSTVLVALLQKQDIHCWVTTTQRKKVETHLSEEAIQTQSTFQFESWREYPDLQRLLKEEE